MTKDEALEKIGFLPVFPEYKDVAEIVCKIYEDFEDELVKAYKEGVKDEARCHKAKENQ